MSAACAPKTELSLLQRASACRGVAGPPEGLGEAAALQLAQRGNDGGGDDGSELPACDCDCAALHCLSRAVHVNVGCCAARGSCGATATAAVLEADQVWCQLVALDDGELLVGTHDSQGAVLARELLVGL